MNPDSTPWSQDLRVLVNPTEAAKALGLKSARTLRKWRQQKRGPNFVRLGHNTIRYRVADLLAYSESLVCRPDGGEG